MKKFQSNLLLGFITFLMTFLSQRGFYFIKNLSFEVPLQNSIVAFLLFFILSFISQKKVRFLLLNFLIILNFIQMVHLEYFGTKIFPFEIYLFFIEQGEIIGALKEELYHFIYPFIFTIIPLIIIYVFNHKLSDKLIKNKYLFYFFILYLVYNPARTFITGNNWGRQPSAQEFDGMNVYLSTSYFLGRILPEKLSSPQPKGEPFKITFTRGNPKSNTIVFVLGESLSSNHLSLFKYERETTPFLKSMKDNKNFYYLEGISSGVSTDVSVAFLINNTFGRFGKNVIIKGNQCLFKLAKDQGYTTHFYSSQSAEQLRYISNSICPKYIDHYASLNDLDKNIKDPNAADDDILLSKFKDIDLSGKHFIVLHQRGSHAPHNLRYKKEIFKINDGDPRINHYDNSVFEFDSFMEKLFNLFNSKSVKGALVYSSDHGEGMGEMGAFGHGQLVDTSFQIPILIYNNVDSKENTLPMKPTHLNLSLYISHLLGYETSPRFNEIIKSYEILGNDIDGMAGFLELEMKEDSYVIKK